MGKAWRPAQVDTAMLVPDTSMACHPNHTAAAFRANNTLTSKIRLNIFIAVESSVLGHCSTQVVLEWHEEKEPS
jgi:hypothetical protein